MKRIIVTTMVLCTTVLAAPTPKQESTDLAKMKQILRAATAGLADKNYRVIFAAEDNRSSLRLQHWIVTLQEYPADYKAVDDQEIRTVASGPPCASGKAADFCSISDVPGEKVFRGRFDLDDARGHFRRFEGSIVSSASKMSTFGNQLAAHQEWTQAEIASALAAAGARFGPDKEREFRATLPVVLNTLGKAFGPMRVHKVSSMKPLFWELQSGQRALIGWPAYWKVIAIPLQRPKDRMVMYFEPFEGQLQQLVETGLFQKWDPKTKKVKWEYLDPDEK